MSRLEREGTLTSWMGGRGSGGWGRGAGGGRGARSNGVVPVPEGASRTALMRCSIVRRRSSIGSSNNGADQRSVMAISRVKGVAVKPKWLRRSAGLSGIFVVSFWVGAVRGDDRIEVGLEGLMGGGGR